MPVLLDPDRIDFAGIVRPGDLVMPAQLGGEPPLLLRALLRQADRLGGIRLLLGFPLSDLAAEAPRDSVRLIGFGGFGVNARLFDERRIEIVPAQFARYADLIARGILRPDVVLLQATPADERGRHSLGVTVDCLPTAIAEARAVVAEINARMPWTDGDSVIDGAQLDYAVRAAQPPAEWRPRPPGPVDEAIADHVARLVPDRAVIQYGVGSGPDAIAARLARKRDLGIHSGSLADSYVDLVEAGAVSNRYKEIDPGLSVTTALYGSERLYAFAHRNRSIRMRASSYTHSQEVLRHFECLIAINGALEVDLTGQVNAEAVGGRYIGAVGGQLDFQRAALRSPRGRGIITLAATSRDGRHSRIVARLDGPVTTPRSDADTVVTEYGVAELQGRTLEERARALIAIAHPDHRAALAGALDDLA